MVFEVEFFGCDLYGVWEVVVEVDEVEIVGVDLG